jgi:hypothetical protein
VGEQVGGVDHQPAAIADGGLEIDVQQQTTAQVTGGDIEGLVLDAGVGAQQRQTLLRHEPADQRVDPRRVGRVDNHIDVVAGSVGQILVVAHGHPAQPGAVERGEQAGEEGCDPVGGPRLRRLIGPVADPSRGAVDLSLGHGVLLWPLSVRCLARTGRGPGALAPPSSRQPHAPPGRPPP